MRRRLSDSVSSFSHYLENSREHFIRIWKTLNFVQRVSAIWRFSNYVTLLFSVLKILRTMPACYLWCTTGLPFSGRVVCFAVQWCQYHDQFIKLAKLKASFLELFSLCKSEDKLQTLKITAMLFSFVLLCVLSYVQLKSLKILPSQALNRGSKQKNKGQQQGVIFESFHFVSPNRNQAPFC